MKLIVIIISFISLFTLCWILYSFCTQKHEKETTNSEKNGIRELVSDNRLSVK